MPQQQEETSSVNDQADAGADREPVRRINTRSQTGTVIRPPDRLA